MFGERMSSHYTLCSVNIWHYALAIPMLSAHEIAYKSFMSTSLFNSRLSREEMYKADQRQPTLKRQSGKGRTEIARYPEERVPLDDFILKIGRRSNGRHTVVLRHSSLKRKAEQSVRHVRSNLECKTPLYRRRKVSA